MAYLRSDKSSVHVPVLFGSTEDVNVPGSNAAAVLTYNSAFGQRHCISAVYYSYVGGTPTGATLTIKDGNNTVFSIDVAAAGPGSFMFVPALTGSVNTAMEVRLTAGGSGVQGKVNVRHWLEKSAGANTSSSSSSSSSHSSSSSSRSSSSSSSG